MTSVKFQKISIKNFLSIGNEPVEVEFRPGVHILTGQNLDKQDRRNGVGKSTVADAIHFALFGTTIRNLKKDNMVNNLTCDTAEVVLDFIVTLNGNGTSYRVVRQLAPSRCYFYIDGEDKTRDSIGNTTAMIEDVIAGSPEVFQNCVIMTLNNTTPFMAQKKQDKRKFIESVFDLEIFSRMVSQLRSDYSDCKIEHDQEVARSVELNQQLQLLQGEKDQEKQHRLDQKEKYLQRQSDNAAEIEQLRSQITDQDDTIRDDLKKKAIEFEKQLEKCEETVTKLARASGQHHASIRMLNSNFDQMASSTTASCPVCLRQMKDHDHAHINQEKERIQKDVFAKETLVKEIESKVQQLDRAKLSLRNSVKTIRGKIKEYDRRTQENKGHLQRIAQLEEWQHQLRHDLDSLVQQRESDSSVIETTRKRLVEIEKGMANLKTQLKILDVVKFVVSEEGVKSYIVRQILQLFNNKLAYYLRRLDSNCVCIFNEYFEEEIINEKGKMCVYENFSGAERKAIDLACLFTFMDIRRLQGNISYNVSIYDELLDTSVDEKGIEMVLDILRERADQNGECIIIISHRKESVKNSTGDVIFLQKENGITTRREYVDQS